SATAEQATGWRAGEIVGRRLATLLGDDGASFGKKDGSRLPVVIARTAMHDAGGRVSAYAALATDGTHDTAKEADIDRLNRQLELRVAELADANDELEAFSYSVSHDL